MPRPLGFGIGTGARGWVARTLAVWAGVQLLAMACAGRAMASLVFAACLASWTGGEPWRDVERPSGTRRARDLALVGVAAGVLLGFAEVAVSRALGQLRVVWSGAQASVLGIGLVASVLAAVRDELVLRAMPLRAVRESFPKASPLAGLGICAAVAAAARWGSDGTWTADAAVDALRAVAFGACWMVGGGPALPCAANAGWRWADESLVRGGLFDVRYAGRLSMWMPHGVVGVIAACAAVAAVVQRRRAATGRAAP